MCRLIESQHEMSLPEQCLMYYDKKPNESQSETSPYYTAAWFVFRNQSTHPSLKRVDIRQMLLWASQSAYDKLQVLDNPAQKSNHLKKTLIDATCSILQQKDAT